MRKFKLLASLLLVINLAGFSQDSLQALNAIHGIDVSGDVQVEIRIRDTPGMTIKSDDLEQDCFIHDINEGILTLKIKPNINCDGDVKVTLSIPSLKEIKLTGKAEISNTGILKTDTLTLYQQLGSKAYLDVNVKHLEVKLMEGSVLEISGYADSQSVSVNSKASYDALELKSDVVDITANLLGIAKLCADKQLKAKAGSNAYILYRCDPEQTDFKTSLGGKIEKSTD